jgi:hypothetical protein
VPILVHLIDAVLTPPPWERLVHLIELPKFTKRLEELEKPLDLWLYFLQNGEQLDADALPGSLDIPEIRWAAWRGN